MKAKRTMERALAATRKRHAHRLANAAGTDVQNEPQVRVQNEIRDTCREAKSQLLEYDTLAGAPGFEPGNGGIKTCLIIQ